MKICVYLALALSFSVSAFAQESDLLSQQKTFVNSDKTISIMKPFVIYQGEKHRLVSWEYNGYDITLKQMNADCRLFGLGDATNKSVVTIDQKTAQETKIAWTGYEADGTLSVPVSYHEKYDLYESLTCQSAK